MNTDNILAYVLVELIMKGVQMSKLIILMLLGILAIMLLMPNSCNDQPLITNLFKIEGC